MSNNSSRIQDFEFRAALLNGDDKMLHRIEAALKPIVVHYFWEEFEAPASLGTELFNVGLTALWERGRRKGFEEGFNFYSYLLQASKQCLYNRIRGETNHEKKVRNYAVEVLKSSDSDVQTLLEHIELKKRVFDAVNQLPTPCRKLMLLWADKTPYPEIVAALNYSDEKSAHTQVYKCKIKLRKIWNKINFNKK